MVQSDQVMVPESVLQGIAAVRDSGRTNMLDVQVVSALAIEMGHPDAAVWIDENRTLYCEGVFRGFVVTGKGGETPCAGR
jgi:hypothetical protein